MEDSGTVRSPIIELRSGSQESKPRADHTAPAKRKGSLAPQKDDIFFDTINIQFHIENFITQLSAHLILPLFFLLGNFHGQIGKGPTSFLGAFIAPIALYLMLLAYSQIPEPNQVGIEWAFLIPLVYFVQHRTVIAIKYASMSKTEYRKFMDCKDDDRCEAYLFQMQLVQGWYAFNPAVVHFELAAASARVGARINEIDLRIADPSSSPSALNQLRAWNAFLRGHDVIDFDSAPCRQLRRTKAGDYALSVFDLCEALLMRAAKHRPESDAACYRLTNLYGAVNLLIPLVLVACHSAHVSHMGAGGQGWLAVFLMSSTLLNSFYAQLFYVLLFTAVADVLRQLSVMTNLNDMIRITDISMDVEVSARGLREGAGYWECAEEQQRVHQRIEEILSIASAPYTDGAVMEGQAASSPLVPEDCMMAGWEEGGPGPAPPCAPNPNEDGTRNVAAFIHIPLYSFPASRPAAADAPTASTDLGKGDSAQRPSVLGERIYRDNELPLLPRLDMQRTHNIVAWTHARLAMQHFGERFHFRLEMYVVASIAMLLLLMVLGLANLGMASDRVALFLSPWFLQTLVAVTMCIAFNVLIMQCGAEVNEVLAAHGHTLSKHALLVHRKMERLSLELERAAARGDQQGAREALQQRRDQLAEVACKLTDMRDVVESSTALKPYKVFGFTAQSSLTMSIVSAAVSFYGILLSLMCSHGETQALTSL